MLIANVFGITGGATSMISIIPQLIKTIKSGSVKGLSIGMIWLNLFSMSNWMIYGILTDSSVITSFNAVKIGFLCILLSYFARDKFYRNKPLKISDALNDLHVQEFNDIDLE